MATFTQRMYCETKEIVRGHRLDIHSLEPLFMVVALGIIFNIFCFYGGEQWIAVEQG